MGAGYASQKKLLFTMSDGGGDPPTSNFPLKNMSEKSLPGEYNVYQHQPLFQTTTNITL